MMGDIKIQISEITIPNDFKVYYKSGITPYPFDSGYTDYGQTFSGGTEVIDLIGDFSYGEQYWIMGKELNFPDRWMTKNILINDAVIYQSFIIVSPTPTPTMTPTPTITPSITHTPSKTPLRSPTPTPTITQSVSTTPSKTPSMSITPSVTHTPSITPTASPTIFGYGVTLYNCSGVICGTSIGSAQIQTTIFLTVGKFYTINDPSGDIIRVDSIQALGGSSVIVSNGSFNSCNEACAAF